ncbi:MAG TPA: ABC transporter permease [Opitutaceae bacterium]
MLSDLRFAIRQLARSPGFAFVAIATLAIGIGACTAMFSIVNAVLLKPLPFRDPASLVWIENTGGEGLSGRTSRADVFNGWRDQNRSFESLAAYFAFFDYGRYTLTGSGTPERLRGVGVSDNFLPTLGISLQAGRNFTADECKYNAAGAVILSYKFWRSHFAGDPSVIGRSITLNNAPASIVGVLPQAFDFASVFSPGNEIELITPFPLTAETANEGNTVFGIGRLRPAVSAQESQSELAVISKRLRQTALKNVGDFGAVVRPLNDALRGKFRTAFYVLSGAVACVLAIACVNLSNLLLARINMRRQEFAVRIAVGARPRHLAQQSLTESLLLASAGCVVGVPLAMWATGFLARLQTFGVPLMQDATVDPLALAVTVGLTLLAGVACGVLPAIHLAGTHKGQGLQNATQQRTAGRSATLARDALIVAEVALACMLLVGAGLLLKSFNDLLQVNLGFQPDHAMAWRVDPPRNFKGFADFNAYIDGLVGKVASVPGVTEVGLSDTLPLGRNRTWGAGLTGVRYPEGRYPYADPRIIDRRYLQAMKVPLLEGRFFEERDTDKSAKSVIINQSLARDLSPDRSAIGQKIDVNGTSTVIGVVANVRNSSLEKSGGNEMYLDFTQSGDWSAIEMVVRSPRPPEALVPEVRAALAAYDPTIPNGEFYRLERLVDDAVAPRRLITQMLGFFSALALILAALGLYGVISYSVGQRTQEIGIRMAIGAQRGDVLQLVLYGGLKLIALGVGIGLCGAFALTRVLQGLLFGVTAHDPLIFAGNAALLVLVGAAACILPSLRATRIDPIEALRAE